MPKGHRASNHEGSYLWIEKLQQWRYREKYIDNEGKNREKYIYSKTRAELKEKVQKWKEEQSRGLNIRKTMKLKDYAIIYLELTKPTVRQRTYDGYWWLITKKIIPILGEKRIYRITVTDWQKMFNAYAQKLSPVTVNDIRRRAIVMMNAALAEGIVERNTASLTKPIHEPIRKIKALTLSQMYRLLEILDAGDYVFGGRKKVKENESQIYNKDRVRILIYLALASGCRIGELLALSWDHVDFEHNSIQILHSLSPTTKGIQVEDVKTKNSYRTVQLPAQIMEMLKDWKHEQDKYAERLANLYENKLRLLFTNAWGKPIDSSNFYSRYWSKLKKAADLPEGFTFHSLRKTHATLLIQSGVNIKVVSQRLGHSNTSVTANIYQAILPDMQDQAVESLNKMIQKREEEKKRNETN